MPRKRYEWICHSLFHDKESNKRIKTYRNLNLKCFSIVKDGKVIDHRDEFIFEDARCLVKQGGRKRTLREKRKNVHAFISGFWADSFNVSSKMNLFNPIKITYDPYKTDSFVLAEDMKTKVNGAEFVSFDIKKGIFAFGVY